ncbi:hypothetical protein KAU92_02380 [Candidatus Bathyarchaeota archaeon]|nr:hypothetical protein [Candidatus Bathyarchaeota archaeon]
MGKPLKAFRFHPDVYSSFKKVAGQGGYSMTAALEKFMEVCIREDRLVFPGPVKAEDAEREARIMLVWLKKKKYWYYFKGEGQLSVVGRLLELLPKVKDSSLKNQIEKELKKH